MSINFVCREGQKHEAHGYGLALKNQVQHGEAMCQYIKTKWVQAENSRNWLPARFTPPTTRLLPGSRS
jgi:hypothetical protein